jgi:hypothetical protein
LEKDFCRFFDEQLLAWGSDDHCTAVIEGYTITQIDLCTAKKNFTG